MTLRAGDRVRSKSGRVVGTVVVHDGGFRRNPGLGVVWDNMELMHLDYPYDGTEAVPIDLDLDDVRKVTP